MYCSVSLLEAAGIHSYQPSYVTWLPVTVQDMPVCHRALHVSPSIPTQALPSIPIEVQQSANIDNTRGEWGEEGLCSMDIVRENQQP